MNVSKIGVTQILPKSHPIYKEFSGVAEIRKRVLKDGSIAVAVYNKGRDIATHFRVYKKDADVDNGDIFEKEILAKDIETRRLKNDHIAKTIEKTKFEHDSFGQHRISNYIIDNYFNKDNELLDSVTSLRKEYGYLKIKQHSTKLGQEAYSLPIRTFVLEDKNGIFEFQEDATHRKYTRKPLGSTVTRIDYYKK